MKILLLMALLMTSAANATELTGEAGYQQFVRCDMILRNHDTNTINFRTAKGKLMLPRAEIARQEALRSYVYAKAEVLQGLDPDFDLLWSEAPAGHEVEYKSLMDKYHAARKEIDRIVESMIPLKEKIALRKNQYLHTQSLFEEECYGSWKKTVVDRACKTYSNPETDRFCATFVFE